MWQALSKPKAAKELEQFQKAHEEEQAHAKLLHEHVRTLLEKSAEEQILKTSKGPATTPAAAKKAMPSSDSKQSTLRTITKRKKKAWAIKAVHSQRTLETIANSIRETCAAIQRESVVFELLLVRENDLDKPEIDAYVRTLRMETKAMLEEERSEDGLSDLDEGVGLEDEEEEDPVPSGDGQDLEDSQ